jgi:hypothetical protein
MLKKKFIEKITLIWNITKIMLEALYQHSFYMFIKMLDEIKENLTPK